MFKRLDNENEEQFLWRIGQAKDNGLLDLSWEEIADIVNKEFREDIYISELREAKHEVRKEKQKLFDERTAMNKTLRETARIEEDLAKLETLIKDNGCFSFPDIQKEV